MYETAGGGDFFDSHRILVALNQSVELLRPTQQGWVLVQLGFFKTTGSFRFSSSSMSVATTT